MTLWSYRRMHLRRGVCDRVAPAMARHTPQAYTCELHPHNTCDAYHISPFSSCTRCALIGMQLSGAAGSAAPGAAGSAEHATPAAPAAAAATPDLEVVM